MTGHPQAAPSYFDTQAVLQQALAQQKRGNARKAETLCRRVLQTEPRNASALHLLGVLAMQGGRPKDAVPLLSASLIINPIQCGAHSNLGTAWMALGHYERALECLDAALRLQPHYAIALLNRGICLTHLGRFELAVAALSLALHESPSACGLLNRGVALERLGRLEEAIADYDQAARLDPTDLDSVFNGAVLLSRLGKSTAALAAYDIVTSRRPDHIDAWNRRGLALLGLGDVTHALASFDRGLALAPTHADLHNNRGLALRHLQRLDEALLSFERAITLRGGFVEALSNRGWVLFQLGHTEEATTSLQEALAIRPDCVEALTNLGAALRVLDRTGEAMQCFDRALVVDPNCLDALGNRGGLLLQARQYEDAIASFKRLQALGPATDYALGNLFEAQLRCCDWGDYEELGAQIEADAAEGRHVIRPFFLLALTDSPTRQLACARLCAERHGAKAVAPAFPLSPRRHHRLRLAYVSGDLGEHAVSYLMAGVFEQHDRDRFEVMAISLRPPQESATGRRVRAAFDQFIDVTSKGDRTVTACMREFEVDIAIDLSGYTGAGRPGIFLGRAAPVQVNYLGFPGTTGLECMDYILADEFVVPPESRAEFAEHVVYLPHSFQANDHRRVTAETTPARSDCNLPERGFVFCSFNNSYKLNPPIFRVWLRLLRAVPDSVLWLVADSELVEQNLRRFAASEGVAAERLVFASRVPYAEHLARLPLADLFLDSLPFNAGTTASDALWAGVPLLTCAGAAFASRMAGSLLRTLGLPELITYQLADYEMLALRLAREPALLSDLRARLAVNRTTSPLFNTAHFCRDLERAFELMWERHRRGDAPVSFSVSATDARAVL